MNEDRLKGKAKRAEGAAQEKWGELKESSSDAADEARDEDAADRTKEKARAAWDEAKDKVGGRGEDEKRSDGDAG